MTCFGFHRISESKKYCHKCKDLTNHVRKQKIRHEKGNLTEKEKYDHCEACGENTPVRPSLKNKIEEKDEIDSKNIRSRFSRVRLRPARRTSKKGS